MVRSDGGEALGVGLGHDPIDKISPRRFFDPTLTVRYGKDV